MNLFKVYKSLFDIFTQSAQRTQRPCITSCAGNFNYAEPKVAVRANKRGESNSHTLRLCFTVRTATYERSKVCLCVILHKRRAQFYCIAFAKLCELCVRFFRRTPIKSNECMHGGTPTALGRTRRASLPANHFPSPH